MIMNIVTHSSRTARTLLDSHDKFVIDCTIDLSHVLAKAEVDANAAVEGFVS